MKKYKFLDGSEIVVDDSTCRGCFLEEAESLPMELNPVWSDDFFVIRQDAECPVPGFYIVSARQHIHSIGDLSCERSAELGVILTRLRAAMLDVLRIERVHVFLEERLIEPHLHIWMLPLWPQVMAKHKIDPKIWNSNILEYLSLFSYEENRDLILGFNEAMTSVLAKDRELMHYYKAE